MRIREGFLFCALCASLFPPLRCVFRKQGAEPACLGAGIGFYDGFLGPGTGNAGAFLWFVPAGSVLWRLALPMAACNLLGGLIGSRLAVWSGNAWIRRVFLAEVAALIARLVWSLYGPDFPG